MAVQVCALCGMKSPSRSLACDCGYAFNTAHDAPLPDDEVRDLRSELTSRRSAGWVALFAGVGVAAMGFVLVPFGVLAIGAIFAGGSMVAGGVRAVMTAHERLAALGPEGVPAARLIDR